MIWHQAISENINKLGNVLFKFFKEEAIIFSFNEKIFLSDSMIKNMIEPAGFQISSVINHFII